LHDFEKGTVQNQTGNCALQFTHLQAGCTAFQCRLHWTSVI